MSEKFEFIFLCGGGGAQSGTEILRTDSTCVLGPMEIWVQLVGLRTGRKPAVALIIQHACCTVQSCLLAVWLFTSCNRVPL